MKKSLMLILCVALLGSMGLAQVRKPGSASTSTSGTVRLAKPIPDIGTHQIFSNFGPAGSTYDATNGYFVSGINNTFNFQKQDIALPFTPRHNALVEGVQVPWQYYGFGTNGATIAIYSDAGGLPGSALARRDLHNFEDFGIGCCDLVSWNLDTPLQVNAGTRYWIVGTTDSTNMDAINTWDFIWNDRAVDFAFQQDDGGWLLLKRSSGVTGPAAAVYGTAD
jgi:hypothetical protein